MIEFVVMYGLVALIVLIFLVTLNTVRVSNRLFKGVVTVLTAVAWPGLLIWWLVWDASDRE